MSIYKGTTSLNNIYSMQSSSAGLPSTYQEVEYIQNNRNEWIDTGVTVTSGVTSIDMKYKILAYDTSLRYPEVWGLAIWTGSAGFRSGFNEGNWQAQGGLSNNYNDFNVDITCTGTATLSTSRTIFLFGQNEGQTTAVHYKDGDVIMYYCKIYQSGVAVRDLVPCYRKSDNVVGMYDLVTNTFYTNANSTGGFSAGPNAGFTPSPIKKVYLGSTQVYPAPLGWTLYTETDLENADLGLLTQEGTPWSGGGSRVLASIANSGGIYYFDCQPYKACSLRLKSNYPTFYAVQPGKTNRKIKVVFDYLYATDRGNQIQMGRQNRDSDYGNCITSTTWTRYNRWYPDYQGGVAYTAESIIDVSANTETVTVFDKSTGTQLWTGGPFALSTATYTRNGTIFYENDCWLGYGVDGVGSLRLGDVHIYYQDI